MAKRTIAFGLLGQQLDAGPKGPARWERWRPTIGLCQQEDLHVDRLELLVQGAPRALVERLVEDVGTVSPETEVAVTELSIRDPWDFADVYGALHAFARDYAFRPGDDHLIHITTGTHVVQICWFLLAESRRVPAKLVQTYPPRRKDMGPEGGTAVIDLDLSRYDALAERFAAERADDLSFLKAGIDTRNAAFNRLIEEIETVAIRARDPILLHGPTGAGKTNLARRIYELKRRQHQVSGDFVEVNCATLRGDHRDLSTLFGHKRRAPSPGRPTTRGPACSKRRTSGLLFLDEIGELGLDEQAMLLRAIEEGVFLPVGADRPSASDFQLIAGTNRDLGASVREGTFREDLLARIQLWTFELPGLAARREDVAPNLDFELAQAERSTGRRTTMNKEARQRFLAFAKAPSSTWAGNFRDLNAAVRRMATLSDSGRITAKLVDAETARLERQWRGLEGSDAGGLVAEVLGADRATELDRFDRVQLEEVLAVCRASRSLSDAGRTLFAVSRTKRRTANDADRLSKYLAKFDLRWADVGPDA